MTAVLPPAVGLARPDLTPPRFVPSGPVPSTRWLTERYEVLDELGRGGMSVVYLARERATARLVAVKLVGREEGDADAAARFAREVRVAAALRHPNVVETLAVEEGDGAAALVTAYVPGGTLRAALRAAVGADAPWPYERVAGVLRDVAAALAHAHACRVVHRDVKPENIFLDEAASEDGTGRALLADFGIARPLEHDVLRTAAGGAAGTPSYMAPEQVAGLAVDERTDVYALGLVGWEMLAGRRPWQGETLYALLHKQQHEALPPIALLRPDIPAYLLAAIEGALSKDPAGRWRDGAEFLRQLTPTPAQLPPLAAPEAEDDVGGATVRFTVGPAATAPGAGAGVERAARSGRRWAGVAAGGAMAAAVAALFAWSPAVRGGRSAAPVADVHVAAAPPAASRTAGARVADTRVADTRVADTRVADGVLDRPASAAAPAPSAGPQAAPGGERAAVLHDPLAGERAVDARCGSPAAADRRACRRALVAPADARLAAAYTALLAAMQRSAGEGWEPRAVRALRAEQQRWLAGRERECRARQSAADVARGEGTLAACLADVTARRAAELTARRARFVDAGAAVDEEASDEQAPGETADEATPGGTAGGGAGPRQRR